MNPQSADAVLATASWLPGIAPVWPLVVLVALALPAQRGPVLQLARWAALPALLIALVAPAAVLPLPGMLLGASLQLDTPGRWVLAAVALLWLAGGWLAADWLRSPWRTMAFLLAMAGALCLPLTGDLPSALAASVLAAYPLYALLGGGRGGRALLTSVVIADLLILEALLLLTKASAGLDFTALRTALNAVQAPGIVLALLVLGFGAKAGLMGLHYWLAPALGEARVRVSAMVVAFTLVAGLLPWLRLLPTGDTQWSAAAALIPWLALAGGVWAVVAGLLQATSRGPLAYLLGALASFWLGLLAMAMGPAPAVAGSEVLPAALALSALGMAALLLAEGTSDRYGRLAVWALALLAALLVGVGTLGAALLTAAGAGGAKGPLIGSLGCVGILLGASVTAAGRAYGNERDLEQRASALLVAGGLVMAVLALLARPEGLPLTTTWSSAGVIALTSALLVGAALGPFGMISLARLPRAPAGDLLVVFERMAAGLIVLWERLGPIVGDGRDRLRAALESARVGAARQLDMDAMEALLRRWSTATVLLLVTGAALALLVSAG